MPARPASRASIAALRALGVPVSRITSDSRNVAPGDAFAAYPGDAHDGRAFIGQALDRGACSVLWERSGYQWPREWTTPNAAVTDLRRELGFIADDVYGHPSERLWMIGVTGTNGKTSCAHWIAQSLSACGRRTALAGTLGNGFADALEAAANTTPDAAALQEMLRRWRDAGAAGVAMEVSSHGLDQGRVNGVAFDVALFTNLTRDHLDYHGSMHAYGEAKAKLFSWPTLSTAIINSDDAFGRELLARTAVAGVHALSYGVADADVRVERMEHSAEGIRGVLATPWGSAEFATSIVGAFNVSNLLGVAAVLLASDVKLADVPHLLAALRPVAGRMQKTGGDGKPLAVIDYAHSPDALEKVLTALRPVARARGGRLAVVFGCGGDRDPGKRPLMGTIAARLADHVTITSDNPRSEDPAEIVREIAQGARAGIAPVRIVVDRAAAIAAALASAKAPDVVLIAGKGHEPYQEIAGVRHPFSDLAHAEAALSKRGAS
jgi:UDP-N-acetylmuramoyl-L-alanyl-D-glutamate--2,6-diaminopimelate ligase